MVHQSSRSRDDDVWASSELGDLLIHGRATDEDGGLQAECMTNLTKFLVYLDGELSRWSKDKSSSIDV